MVVEVICEKDDFRRSAEVKITNVTRSYSEFTTFSEKKVFVIPEINENMKSHHVI